MRSISGIYLTLSNNYHVEGGPALWRTLAYLALARPGRAALELLRGRPRVAWAGLRGTIDGLLAIESQHDGGDQGAAQRGADGVVVQE